MLDAVYNIIEWLVRYAEQLHDHTQPKCYKFIRNASREVWDVLSELFSHAMGKFCCYFKGTAMLF